MWEDASKKGAKEPNLPPKDRETVQAPKRRKGGDTLLWTQLLLCTALIAAVLAARFCYRPLYRSMQRLFYEALEAPGLDLDGGHELAKFTQEAAAELWTAARQVMAEWQTAAQPAAARVGVRSVRRVPDRQAPSGSRLEGYDPPFDFGYPLPFVVQNATSSYGWRTDPVTGQGEEFHTGTDLPVAEGTQVLAAADGVVRVAGSHKSYGNYLRILHPNGDETLYAHMQYLYVRPGQKVQKQQVLGTSGQTGNVTGPHLHFELLHGGIRYDPTEALEQAAG